MELHKSFYVDIFFTSFFSNTAVIIFFLKIFIFFNLYQYTW